MNYIDKMKKRDVYISELGCLITRCRLEGKNSVGSYSVLNEVKTGYGTYYRSNCDQKRASFGRFCSVGNRVTTAVGNHPTDIFVSTHPAFYSQAMYDMFGYVQESKYNEWKWVDEKNRVSIRVGNDVWIANDAILCEGIAIGDGAVVCADAVVTKDVPAYAVVGGVPARIMRYCFSDEIIRQLLDLKIWDHPFDWYKSNAEIFDNVGSF